LLDGVTEGSPAYEAGVRADDVVIELGGRKVENVNEYSIAMGELRPGKETTITVKRGEETLKLKLIPGQR
jgi:S1-C subfamily serine protease